VHSRGNRRVGLRKKKAGEEGEEKGKESHVRDKL
jgi:hypothetical protein